jgi:hypothetical protein
LRRRTYAVLTTAVIAAALVVVYASGATGQGRQGPRVVTFTTVDTITSFKGIDNSPGPETPPLEPRAGDVLLATANSKVGGTTVGGNVTHCQMVTDTQAQCQATWRFNGRRGLRRGSTLTAAGVLNFGAQEISKAPIVGGTGRTRGARGEIVRTTVSPGNDRVRFKVLDE